MSTAFETEMGVLPEIAKAVDEMGWSLPTDIQGDAIPLILGGGDVLMAAETGSGKTGAFCLPLLQIVYESLTNVNKKVVVSNNKWKMNIHDCTGAMAIDSAGTLCQSRDQKAWHGCRANKGVRDSGCYYFETKMTDNGLSRVGWSTLNAKLLLGTCAHGFGFGGSGKKSNNNKFDDYGESFTLGDVVGSCINLDRKEIHWFKNGIDLGPAFKIPHNLANQTFYPAVCLKNAEVLVNFGDSPFTITPNGYKAISKAQNAEKSSIGQVSVAGEPAATKRTGPLAIIMEPSRELAEQTYRQLEKFNKYLTNPQVSLLLVVGGTNTRDQMAELGRGVDIVVATPGRLQDLVTGGVIKLDNCRLFVLDECDGLLAQGHRSLIESIHRLLPRVAPNGDRLQMIVCSATLHSFEVKSMAGALMQFPQWVDLRGEDSVPDTVHHVMCPVDPRADRSWTGQSDHHLTDGVHGSGSGDDLRSIVESPEMMSQAVKLLKIRYAEDAIRQLAMDRAIVFCRTKLDCDQLEQRFIQLGGGPGNKCHQFSCVCLHSGRKPNERKENLELFQRGSVRLLICTDVAARGLDIKGLPYVINVTLPDEKENYVHRIGRVGRAERMGLAISLVATVKEKVWYHSNCNNNKNCYNRRLVDQGGCCIWYNETKLLGDIEEHLGVTIDQVGRQFDIKADEFDGKVVYGEKLRKAVPVNRGHVDVMASTVSELAAMEKLVQNNYLSLRFMDTRY